MISYHMMVEELSLQRLVKKTITSIKTEILDPEGGTANVGDNSGVIYRIDKVINTDLKFAETLMQQMSQKKN